MAGRLPWRASRGGPTVLDASALLALLQREPGASTFTRQHQLPVLTADRAWTDVDHGVEVQLLR